MSEIIQKLLWCCNSGGSVKSELTRILPKYCIFIKSNFSLNFKKMIPHFYLKWLTAKYVNPLSSANTTFVIPIAASLSSEVLLQKTAQEWTGTNGVSRLLCCCLPAGGERRPGLNPARSHTVLWRAVLGRGLRRAHGFWLCVALQASAQNQRAKIGVVRRIEMEELWSWVLWNGFRTMGPSSRIPTLLGKW